MCVFRKGERIATARTLAKTTLVTMEVESAASENKIKDVFDLGTNEVTSDILNSFQDYIADGFDAFEEYIRSSCPGLDSSALKILYDRPELPA